ncbi:MAG: N4-gp56 family major capsid protein, partial [Clostridiales bacterium]|nr:N4-gp56 family major capsid protein [Clostridiales bacterium]
MEKFHFDLQLFAEETVNINATTDAALSVENKTFYDRALIEEAGPNLIHGQFGQKRPIPKNGGKRIQFRKYAALPKALKPLTEGVTPEGRKLSATAVEAEVSQYGDFVCLSDVLDLTAIDNNVLEATKAVGRQAGVTLDTITRNVLQSGTNVYYCPKVGADGKTTAVTDRSQLDGTCTLTVDVVKKVAAMLKAANAPKIAGDSVCILHPYVAYDI